MPAESPDLVAQLNSLRIARAEPTRSGKLWLWVLLAVLAAAAVIAYVFRDRFLVKTVALTPVILLQPGQEAPVFVATGTVTAPVTDNLAPRTAGRLLRLLVQEGDIVEAGQPVALLDPTDRKLAVTQARAQVASMAAKAEAADVAVRSAQVKYSRNQRLAQSGAGTQSAAEDSGLDVDSAKAQVAVARADLGVAKASLETAQANLDDTTLRAPFHGVILKTLAQPGDFVSTVNGQGAVQLADLGSLEVDAEVAEANLAKLKVGMPVEVRLDALPAQGLPGVVFSVRPNVDPAKATAIAKVHFTSLAAEGEQPAAGVTGTESSAAGVAGGVSKIPSELKLYPGMNGRVNFLEHPIDAKTLAAPARLVAPAAALVHGEGGDLGLLMVEGGRVKLVPVQVSGSDGDRVVLKQGPPAGSLVVQDPTSVKVGDRVQAKGE